MVEIGIQFSSVQLLSHVRLFATPWIAAHQASLSITNSLSSLRLTSIESVMPSSHLILCHPQSLPASVFSNESALRMRWPKFWSFSIRPSNEHPGLISFRMDWLDLLAVQGTLKSLLQHDSSKASILRGSAFFTVQLSRPYLTTGKNIALTRWTFVGKVMSLLFNMLSLEQNKIVYAQKPRSVRKKEQYIHWTAGGSRWQSRGYIWRTGERWDWWGCGCLLMQNPCTKLKSVRQNLLRETRFIEGLPNVKVQKTLKFVVRVCPPQEDNFCKCLSILSSFLFPLGTRQLNFSDTVTPFNMGAKEKCSFVEPQSNRMLKLECLNWNA